ncbi:MAG: nickel-dependent hydrogenase large subunit, partial [Methylocystaceae bacterium]
TASYYNSGSKNSGQKPGIGLSEVHRGGLLHRMTGAQGQISHYELITPSEWNFSPRDQRGIPGPVEQSLTGLKLSRPEHPVEVYRTLRSFDPCISCATHLMRAAGSQPAY